MFLAPNTTKTYLCAIDFGYLFIEIFIQIRMTMLYNLIII